MLFGSHPLKFRLENKLGRKTQRHSTKQRCNFGYKRGNDWQGGGEGKCLRFQRSIISMYILKAPWIKGVFYIPCLVIDFLLTMKGGKKILSSLQILVNMENQCRGIRDLGKTRQEWIFISRNKQANLHKQDKQKYRYTVRLHFFLKMAPKMKTGRQGGLLNGD